jgi:hypothetical protein
VLKTSQWAFGFMAVTALAWIVALLVVLAVGGLFAMQSRRATA